MPVRYTDAPFLLPVENVLTITGRGTVVTGAVERGVVKLGDRVELIGAEGETLHTVVTGVETFGKPMEFAQAGDNVALLLRSVERGQVRRGMIVAAPGSVTPRSASPRRSTCSRRRRAAAARRSPPATGRSSTCAPRTSSATWTSARPARRVPGQTVEVRVELGRPTPVEVGLGFAIREGGRTVGAGTVTAVAE